MNAFTNFGISKDAKIAIDGIQIVIPKSRHNHNGAWPKVFRSQLLNAGWKNVDILTKNDTYEDYDAIILTAGTNYDGKTINFFFGLDDNVVWRINRIQEAHRRGIPLFMIGFPFPELGTIIEGRLNNKSTSSNVGILDIDLFKQLPQSVSQVDCAKNPTHLLFGDSHSPAAYKAGLSTCKNDGLTLHSTLRDGIGSLIKERAGVEPSSLKHLSIYLGNIDIRHHLMRQEDPEASTYYLANELGRQLSNLGVPSIEIINLLPIEHESRKIPKTGWYEKAPYFGSTQERANLVCKFNDRIDMICQERGWQSFKWPAKFINDDGELKFDLMERPRSFHLSPVAYRWDIINNCDNLIHTAI